MKQQGATACHNRPCGGRAGERLRTCAGASTRQQACVQCCRSLAALSRPDEHAASLLQLWKFGSIKQSLHK